METLLIDNDDSFTQILAHLITCVTKKRPHIIHYDFFNPHEPITSNWVIISPGPGHPREYPKYKTYFEITQKPTLGICMGMQLMNHYHEGSVGPLNQCVHGQSDTISLGSRTYTVARYHSLYIKTLSPSFCLLSANAEGTPMVIHHASKPMLGYQFHPESFLTDDGYRLIEFALDTLFKNEPK